MVEFIINEQLPSLNDYINKLKSPKGVNVGAGFKKHIDERCSYYIMQYYRPLKNICKEPVYIFFHWHEKAKRRDVDNVYSAKKYILDAMQKCEVLENDNPAHVVDVFDSHSYGGTKDYVIVSVVAVREYAAKYGECDSDVAK